MIYYNRGIDAFNDRRYADAVALNRKALLLDAENKSARGNLLASINNWSLALADAGQFDAAEALLAAGRKFDPNHAAFAHNAAHIQQQRLQSQLIPAAHAASNSAKKAQGRLSLGFTRNLRFQNCSVLERSFIQHLILLPTWILGRRLFTARRHQQGVNGIIDIFSQRPCFPVGEHDHDETRMTARWPSRVIRVGIGCRSVRVTSGRPTNAGWIEIPFLAVDRRDRIWSR